MGESTPWRVASVIPTLGVDDLEAACGHYARLGFELSWRYPENGETEQVGLRFGQVTVMLSHCPDAHIERQNLYFILKNVRPYHEHLQAVLPEVGPLVEADYGMRDFSISDPWGHRLTFGEES